MNTLEWSLDDDAIFSRLRQRLPGGHNVTFTENNDQIACRILAAEVRRLQAALAEKEQQVVQAVREAADQYMELSQQLAASQQRVASLECQLKAAIDREGGGVGQLLSDATEEVQEAHKARDAAIHERKCCHEIYDDIRRSLGYPDGVGYPGISAEVARVIEQLQKAEADRDRMKAALEVEYAENCKLKYGAVLFDFESFVASQLYRINAALATPAATEETT